MERSSAQPILGFDLGVVSFALAALASAYGAGLVPVPLSSATYKMAVSAGLVAASAPSAAALARAAPPRVPSAAATLAHADELLCELAAAAAPPVELYDIFDSERDGSLFYLPGELHELVADHVDAPEDRAELGGGGCAHLLVKHTESRNPVSRRTGEQITMSKDHARRYLEGLLEGIKAAPDSETAFRELCSSRSDCGSYREAGDLGDFGRGQMQRPFEEATFALKGGELSGVVDTSSSRLRFASTISTRTLMVF